MCRVVEYARGLSESFRRERGRKLHLSFLNNIKIETQSRIHQANITFIALLLYYKDVVIMIISRHKISYGLLFLLIIIIK